MTPTGRFGIRHEPGEARTHVGIAAGSGITPILSIVRGILAREPKSRFFLFYGNRSTANVLFREALAELKDRFMGRLSVFHVLSQEEQDLAVLNGRLDGDKVRLLLRSLVPASAVDHVFICGPEGMAEDIGAALAGLGIAARQDSRGALRFRARRPAAGEARPDRARRAEPGRHADLRRQAPRRARRRRRGDPRRRAARRRGPALRLQGRHVRDLPCQGGLGRGDHGGELLARALGAGGGLRAHLPGPPNQRPHRRRLRPRCSRRNPDCTSRRARFDYGAISAQQPGHQVSAAIAPEITTASVPPPKLALPASTRPGRGLLLPWKRSRAAYAVDGAVRGPVEAGHGDGGRVGAEHDVPAQIGDGASRPAR